ncbi:MAG: hypothetical protein TREMPRED_000379 [Tremellales sp. Tagirdzhanova-0007]|nr:MAG: hypothetical protein TREMPRED_000379 [Tremellales sp. Tagirdzhanova-0007]
MAEQTALSPIITVDGKKELNKEWVNWIRNQDDPTAEAKIKAAEEELQRQLQGDQNQ